MKHNYRNIWEEHKEQILKEHKEYMFKRYVTDAQNSPMDYSKFMGNYKAEKITPEIDNQTIDYMNKWVNITESLSSGRLKTATEMHDEVYKHLMSTEGIKVEHHQYEDSRPPGSRGETEEEKRLLETKEKVKESIHNLAKKIEDDMDNHLLDALSKPKKKWHFAKGIIPWRKSDDVGVKKENAIMWGIHIKNNPDEHKKENTINNLKYKTMRKEDLKTGMRTELRNGDFSIVILGYNDTSDIMVDENNTFLRIDEFKPDLCEIDNEEYDIIKVWAAPRGEGNALDLTKKGELLWNREDEKTFVIKGVEYSESTLISLIKKATE